MGIFSAIGFLLERVWNSAKQEQEAALAEYDMQREARMIAREQMDMEREQAKEGRLRRREMRREYKRRRRNYYSVSDDEVEYGTQRRPRSRAISRLSHLGFRSQHKPPKVYTSGVGASPPLPTPPPRATSAGPDGRTPNLAHLAPVTRTASAEAFSPAFLHPSAAGAAEQALARRTPRASRNSSADPTAIPEDYGAAQFAKEERWRTREARRLEKEAERERRDAAYDQTHYGPDAYDPYAPQK